MENSAEQADSPQQEPASPGSDSVGSSDPVRGSRVLVVAADSKSRWVQVGALREAGAQVAEARDGLEALEIARQSRPDLVVATAELPELPGDGLRTALRRDPDLGNIPVVILGDTLPPTGNSHVEERALTESVVALIEARRLEGSHDEPLEDASVDRENLRAQSTVSMYRQPANRVPRSSHPVWRLRTSRDVSEGRTVSGFDSELRVMSRILGGGFVALVAAILGLIGWQLAATPTMPEADGAPETSATAESTEQAEASEPAPGKTLAPDDLGAHQFSGELRDGFDASLAVGPGQGVLELSGPAEVTVVVDGIDRGALPVQLVLDQGRHVVRYRYAGRRSVRFYFIEAGSTRVLEVITRPGGFVDAR
jgi:CheY-like chemotaxis protein